MLKAAARTLAERLRPPDRLARFGGEEFLVLLPGKDTAAAAAQAEELRRHLASRRADPLDRPLSASFGVAALRSGETAEGLVMRADAALGRAKRNGRDRVEVDA